MCHLVRIYQREQRQQLVHRWRPAPTAAATDPTPGSKRAAGTVLCVGAGGHRGGVVVGRHSGGGGLIGRRGGCCCGCCRSCCGSAPDAAWRCAADVGTARRVLVALAAPATGVQQREELLELNRIHCGSLYLFGFLLQHLVSEHGVEHVGADPQNARVALDGDTALKLHLHVSGALVMKYLLPKINHLLVNFNPLPVRHLRVLSEDLDDLLDTHPLLLPRRGGRQGIADLVTDLYGVLFGDVNPFGFVLRVVPLLVRYLHRTAVGRLGQRTRSLSDKPPDALDELLLLVMRRLEHILVQYADQRRPIALARLVI
mmetsp:Transcript_28958/g.72174  ORF Transcript_28958/g.72174 Transcript_28958/m.72174 type:complete len:314 (-) Transcript_28958:361-1302(-)